MYFWEKKLFQTNDVHIIIQDGDPNALSYFINTFSTQLIQFFF